MSQAAAINRDKGFDVLETRAQFPILRRTVHEKPLVYLDNAATTQKPQVVIDALTDYYTRINANIHRGVHTLSGEATDAAEGGREDIRRFLNARSTSEIIFTRGTTEAINLVAQSLVLDLLKPGDEVVITGLEHHSNIVPWQQACARSGAMLRVAPINDRGEVDPEAYQALLNARTRIVAISHVSNALGTVNPVAEMTRSAHAVGAKVLVDGAQATAHVPVDVQAIGCDFYALSGHKMFAPTGIGVLYGREALLEQMSPWQGGGDMIKTVSFEHTEYNDLPYKFEAGTPNIEGMIALGAAVRFLEGLDLEAAYAHEHALLAQVSAGLDDLPGLNVVGKAAHKTGVYSFTIEGAHPHDLGVLLDGMGIAIRTGHHCAMPVMSRYGLSGTARASFALYNTAEDAAAFIAGVRRAADMLV